jgi:PAS domain S-box-containing protein
MPLREFEALFNAALDAVLVVDDARRFVDVNPAACRLLGLTRDALLGRPIDEFLRPGDAGVDEVWQSFMASGTHVGEVCLVNHEGRKRQVEYSATAHFVPGRHLALLRDVTDRKHAERERAELLQREQERLRETQTLLAVSRTLSSTLDPVETMRRVAREIALALGADMVGAYLADAARDNLTPIAGYRVPKPLLHAFLRFPIPIRHHPAMEEAWAERRPFWTDDAAADPRIDRASYARFPHRTNLFVPIRIKDDVVGGFFVIWWTARRSFSFDELRLVEGISALAGIFLENAQLYRQAADANRAKDEFLAALSHELRNPLSAISSAASALDRADVPPDLGARLRQIIHRQTRHLARLLDDLLDVARVTAGKIVLRREPVPLDELVQRSVQAFRERGAAGGRRITFTGVPVSVSADPTRIEQIVVNLLDNAAKFTAADERVDVTVRREGEDAVVRVADNGIGIAPETLSRIFELFAQGERPADRPVGGLGVGLTLARRLAEMHRGTLAASSEGAGRGSEFVLRLPVADGPARAPAPSPDREPPRSRSILLIEDNDDARESLRILLESLGHRVIEAADGAEGTARATSDRPEIVLIDLGLPAVDGYEVARRLRASPGGEAMMLIAVTGYGRPEDRARSTEAGFDAHLVKPVNEAELAWLLSRDRRSSPSS